MYTSLDPELQRAASEAVDSGRKNVDDLVRKRHKKNDSHILYPQVALVALNLDTGQILALIGGRNYGVSQFNDATAERPTGSIFKPFVYAAAYNTSLNGMDLVFGSKELNQSRDRAVVNHIVQAPRQLRPRRVSHGESGALLLALSTRGPSTRQPAARFFRRTLRQWSCVPGRMRITARCGLQGSPGMSIPPQGSKLKALCRVN